MMKRAAILFVSVLSACAFEDPDLGSLAEPINGVPLQGNASNYVNGVVRVHVPGDSRVRTGIIVAPDLVLTSARWVPANVNANAVSVVNGTTAKNGQVRFGAYVTVNPYLPVAIIQTTQPFTNAAVAAIDSRSPSQLVADDTLASCYAYASENEFLYAAQEVRRTDGAREYIVGGAFGSLARLDDWDAGAPCFDSGAATWVGFALSSPGNGETRVFAASSIAFFVDAMKRVANLRRTQGWPTPFMVQTTAPNGSRMCLDIPWGSPYDHAGLNQFPCHGGANQRWLLDYSNPNGSAFVNMMTGTCIDVPGFSTTPGQGLQMYRCNGGPNQAWRSQSNAWPLPGNMLSPLSSPTIWTPTGRKQTLCMAVRGGASNSSRPIEQNTCNVNAAYMDWYLGYQI